MYIEKKVKARRNEIAIVYGANATEFLTLNKRPPNIITITNKSKGAYFM